MKKKKIKKNLIILGILILILLGMVISLILIHQPKEEPVSLTEEQKLIEQGIQIVNKENFTSEANTLLEKGYSADEINQIYEYMSDKNIVKILTNNKVDLSKFYQISNFDFDKIDRYLAYQTSQGIEMKQAVTEVNLNLDTDFYTNIETTRTRGCVLFL